MDFWETITTDRYILDYVEGIKIPFVSEPYQHKSLNQIHCSSDEKLAMDKEIFVYVQNGPKTYAQ